MSMRKTAYYPDNGGQSEPKKFLGCTNPSCFALKKNKQNINFLIRIWKKNSNLASLTRDIRALQWLLGCVLVWFRRRLEPNIGRCLGREGKGCAMVRLEGLLLESHTLFSLRLSNSVAKTTIQVTTRLDSHKVWKNECLSNFDLKSFLYTNLAYRWAAESKELEPLYITSEVTNAHNVVELLARQCNVVPLFFNQPEWNHLLWTKLQPNQ